MLSQIQLYSKEAEHLFEAVLNGKELDVLELQLDRLQREGIPPGKLEIRIQGPKRSIVVFAFASLAFSSILLLAYHIERKGEPTQAQLDKVRKYIKEIQLHELRGDHEHSDS